MKQNILLEEVQQLRQKSLRGVMNFLAVLFLGTAAIALFSATENGRDASGLFAICFLLLAIIGFVLGKSKLKTQVRDDGIYVMFSPFHRRFQVYKWETIVRIYIRNYDALREFGGCGLKIGPDGSCFTVSGDIGIQLVLGNNRRLLIGTNQAELFGEQLKMLGKLDFPPDSLFRS